MTILKAKPDMSNLITVREAPVGLFLLAEGGLICISEYYSGSGEDQSKNTRDCYIVSSGENYCGGDDRKGFPVTIEIYERVIY